MAETLRELVVALSLDTSNFTRNIRSINQQIREAESEFNAAGAGVDGFGTSSAGAAAKLSMMQSKLQMQQMAVKQYEAAWTQANAKLSASQQMQTKLTASLNSAKTALSAAGQNVDSARTAYEQYRTTLGETDSATIAAKQNLEQAEQEYSEAADKVKLLEGQLEANSKAIQNNVDAASKAKTALNNAKAAVAETEREVNRLSSGWTKAGQALENFSQKCNGIAGALEPVGSAFSKYLTAPVTALGAVAVKASVNFEESMANVRRSVDATEEEYDILAQRIQQMSTETNSSAEEIAGVVDAAGHLGIALGENGDTIMDFTENMIMLGNVSDMTAEEAATAAAKFFNIMGTSSDNYNNFSASVATLGVNFATTEGDIIEMAQRLAGAGKQVGLTESQVLGFATALSSVGIEAQAGGTALSKALINMELAVETGSSSLKDFAKVSGMTAEQFTQTWKSDPAAAFQAFILGLAQMSDEEESAIGTLQDMGIKEVRLRDTTLRLASATELMTNAQKMANQAWNSADIAGQNGLVNAANKIYSTTAARLNQLKNKALMAARTFGDDLLPAINNIIASCSQLLESFLSMDDGQRKVIETFALTAAAVGPVILAIAKLIKTIGSVTGTLGQFALWLGKITTASGGAATAVGGLSAAAAGTALGIGAAAGALAAGAVVLNDYATGAKEARDALGGLKDTAEGWNQNDAESGSYFSSGTLASFGVSEKDFTDSTRDAERWKNDFLAVWQDGQKQTAETVNQWTGSFKTLTEDTRTELQQLKKEAEESGSKATVRALNKDLKSLDNIDKQVASLLKKSAKRGLTDKEKVKLSDLIEQRDALEVKYKLTLDTSDNAGYDELQKQLDARLARLKASGAGQSEITQAYGEAAAAAGNGYKAINDELDQNYEKQYQVIAAMEDGEEKQKQLAALDEKYQQDRQAAAEEYAKTVQQMYGPVLEEQQQAGGISDQMKEILALLSQYDQAMQGGDTKGAAEYLTQINDKVSQLDETQLVDFYGTLTQLQSLADSGFDLKQLFPDLDLSTDLTNLASIGDYLNTYKDEIPGLHDAILGALPQEMQKIAVDLDLTEAEKRWKEFASNPGAITTDAVISSYDDKAAAKALQPAVTASVTAYLESEDGVIKPTPTGLTAYIGQYLEDKDVSVASLKPDNIEAIVTSYSKATGADESRVRPYVYAWVAGYQAVDGITPPQDPTGLTAYIHRYALDKDVNVDELTPKDITAIVTSYQEQTGGVDASGSLRPFVTAYINEYADPGNAAKPTVEVPARIRLSPLERSALETFKAQNKISLDATVKVGNQFASVQDLFTEAARGTVHFYENGVEIPVNLVTEDSVDLNSVLGVDENGEYHVLIVPELGSTQGITDTFNSLNQKDGSGWFSSPSVMDYIHNLQQALSMTDEYGNCISDVMEIQNQLDLIQGNGDAKNLGAFLANVSSALSSGKPVDESVMQSYKDAIDFLSSLDTAGLGTDFMDEVAAGMSETSGETTLSSTMIQTLKDSLSLADPASTGKDVGSDVSGGIGQGMGEYDFSTDAATVATNAEDAARTAFDSHSPAQTMVPLGQDVAAGIGQGATEYYFTTEAPLVVTNLSSALTPYLTGDTMQSLGRNAMATLGAGMAGYSFYSVASRVASNIRTPLAAKISSSQFKSIGLNAMKGLAQGIKDGTADVVDQITAAAEKAVSAAKSKLQIASPSRVFRDEVGVMVMRGFGEGIEKGLPDQERIIQNAAGYLTGDAQKGVTNTTNDNRKTYNQNSSFNVTQNIYANSTSYAEQQRQAAKNFRDIARRI